MLTYVRKDGYDLVFLDEYGTEQGRLDAYGHNVSVGCDIDFMELKRVVEIQQDTINTLMKMVKDLHDKGVAEQDDWDRLEELVA